MREGERTIYFDHAATTPLDGEVFEKMRPYYTENFGNADSPHSFGRAAMRAVDAARDRVAELVGAKPDENLFHVGRHRKRQLGDTRGRLCAEEKGKNARHRLFDRAPRRALCGGASGKRGLLRRLSARQRARRSGNGGFARSAYARDGAGGGDGGEQRDGRRPAL